MSLPSPFGPPQSRGVEGLAAEGSTGGPQDCPPGPEPLKFPPCSSPCPEVWAPLLKSSAMLKKYPSGRHQAGWLGGRRCHWVTTGSCGLFLPQEGGNYSCPVLCGVSESELPVKDHPAWPWAGHPGQDCGGTGFLHSMPSFLSPWASAHSTPRSLSLSSPGPSQRGARGHPLWVREGYRARAGEAEHAPVDWSLSSWEPPVRPQGIGLHSPLQGHQEPRH